MADTDLAFHPRPFQRSFPEPRTDSVGKAWLLDISRAALPTHLSPLSLHFQNLCSAVHLHSPLRSGQDWHRGYRRCCLMSWVCRWLITTNFSERYSLLTEWGRNLGVKHLCFEKGTDLMRFPPLPMHEWTLQCAKYLKPRHLVFCATSGTFNIFP